MAFDGAEAIGASVAASDDDNAFAGGQNFNRGIERIAKATLVLLREELHRVVNALQLTSGSLQVTRMLGTTR